MPEVKQKKVKEMSDTGNDYKFPIPSEFLSLDYLLEEAFKRNKKLFYDKDGENTRPDLIQVIRIIEDEDECWVHWFKRDRFSSISSYDIDAGETFTISHEEDKYFPVEVLQKGKEEFLKSGNGKYKHAPKIYLKKINHRTIKLFVI